MDENLQDRDEVLEHIKSCEDVIFVIRDGFTSCWVCNHRFPRGGVYQVFCRHVYQGFGICEDCLKKFEATKTKDDLRKAMDEFIARIKGYDSPNR